MQKNINIPFFMNFLFTKINNNNIVSYIDDLHIHMYLVFEKYGFPFSGIYDLMKHVSCDIYPKW